MILKRDFFLMQDDGNPIDRLHIATAVTPARTDRPHRFARRADVAMRRILKRESMEFAVSTRPSASGTRDRFRRRAVLFWKPPL